MSSLSPPLFQPSKVVKGCGTCKHLRSGSLYTTCDAFPAGIPSIFTNGDMVHDVSLGEDLDGGVVWESLFEGLPTLGEFLDELDRREAGAGAETHPPETAGETGPLTM